MCGGDYGAQEHHDAPERLSAYPFRTAQAGRQRRAGALFGHGRETGQEKTPPARQGEGGQRVLRTGPGAPGGASARRGGLMGRCRLRLRWNPRGGQDGCRDSGRTAAGRKRGGMSAPSRALTRRAVCRNPHGGPLRQCVHAVLVRTGRGVSAGPGDKGDRQPSPCGVPLMPRLVSLDPARRRSAPDTGIRGRSVWRCGCSCPPTRPKQHLHGRRWRSWR